MTKVTPERLSAGASVPDQALAVPVEPVARLDPTGFDPSRNPCDKIFDHKWLDPVCVEDGCCSLTLYNALKAYVRAQRRMLERWSESDEAKRSELWRGLHACEDAARDALERWGR